jgi:ABC-type dipeptide/oligopeptide/nickel transport system permease subunit
MVQTGNANAGDAPVAAGGAGGNRGLGGMVGDYHPRRPLAVAGLVVLVIAVLDTLLAPLFVSTNTVTSIPFNLGQSSQGPSGAHLLGTDELGQDELARLLLGVHYSVLLAGAALLLAAAVSGVALVAVHLAGRERGQQWGLWAEVVLTPLVCVLLLGVASVVASRQVPPFVPSLFSNVFTNLWSFIQHPSSIVTDIQEGQWAPVLLVLLVVGEVLRLGPW